MLTSTTCFFPARAFMSQPTCRHAKASLRMLEIVLQKPRSQEMLVPVPTVLPLLITWSYAQRDSRLTSAAALERSSLCVPISTASL